MYKNFLKINFCILSVFTFSNCASIVSDSTQVVSVDTPNCKGAKCRMTNSKGVFYIQSTSGSTTIQKAYSDLTITRKKDDLNFT